MLNKPTWLDHYFSNLHQEEEPSEEAHSPEKQGDIFKDGQNINVGESRDAGDLSFKKN